jgi:hypothetical protein
MQALNITPTDTENAALRQVEFEWRDALKQDNAGDVASIMIDLMDAIRAEAKSREVRGRATSRVFDELLRDANSLVSSIRSYVNSHECHSDSVAAQKTTPTTRYIWRVWPIDAVENGAPEWRAVKGGWYGPIAREELEESVEQYLQQPWLAHPMLDWALIGGWLLNAAQDLRTAMETELLASESYRSGRRFGAVTAARLALVDSAQGGSALRQIKLKFRWKHALCCSLLGIMIAMIFPDHPQRIAIATGAWVAFDHWFTVRSDRAELNALADKIDRYSAALHAYKAAWLATNIPAIDVRQLAKRIEEAKSFGLSLSPSIQRLLVAIGTRATKRNGAVIFV